MHVLPLTPSDSIWILEECNHQIIDPLLFVGRHLNPPAKKKKLTQIQERKQKSCQHTCMFQRTEKLGLSEFCQYCGPEAKRHSGSSFSGTVFLLLPLLHGKQTSVELGSELLFHCLAALSEKCLRWKSVLNSLFILAADTLMVDAWQFREAETITHKKQSKQNNKPSVFQSLLCLFHHTLLLFSHSSFLFPS